MPSSARPLTILVLRFAATALVALCAGCAGATPPAPGLPPAGGSAAQPGAPPRLPAPSGIAPRRASTLVHILNGADCEPAPQQHVAPDAGVAAYLDFAPQWNAGLADPAGLAYAVYQFVPDLAHDAPLLHLAWASAPQSGDSAWVAVADFAADRWVWHAWQAGLDIPLDLADKNVDGQGRVLAVVLVTGQHGPWRLGKLRIGANQPPTAQATVDHVNQAPPYKAFVHADASSDPDGVIVSYDYDLDGDGVPDVQGSPDSTAAFNVVQPGSFKGSVWVHDDDGLVAKRDFAWDTNYSACWSPFASDYPVDFTALCPGPNNGYYAAGWCSTVDGGSEHLLLARFNADSTAVWARTLSSAHEDQAAAVEAAADGGAYVAGYIDLSATGGDLVVARYAPDGTLDWQKRWGNYKVGDVTGLAVDNALGKVYVATSFDQDVTGYDAVLLQFDADGTWDWTRVWGATGLETGRGVALDLDGNVLFGCTNIVGADYGGVLLEVSPAGDQLYKTRYKDANSYLIPRGMSIRSDGNLAVFGLSQDGAGTGAPYCVMLDGGLALRWARQYFNVAGVAGDQFSAGRYGPDGRLWLCGTLMEADGHRNGALGWISDDGMQSELLTEGPAGIDNALNDLLLSPDGGVLTGGYCLAQGEVGFQPAGLSATAMSLTFTTPPENLYADTTPPTDGTDVSAAIAGLPGQSAGALIYKRYTP